MADKRLADLTKRYRKRVKEYRFARKRIHVLRAAILKRRRELRESGDPGAKALRFLLDRVGKTESPPESNDSPFLRHWRNALNMPQMKGAPWCGFACMAAWHYGAGKRLPNDTVYTPAIVSRAKKGQGFTAIPPSQARPGDLVVFNFPGGNAVADHVGLARGPAKGGYIDCVEGNTSFTNAGSQANGGAIALHRRPLGIVAVVARPK